MLFLFVDTLDQNKPVEIDRPDIRFDLYTGYLDYHSLTLRQKIGQMIIAFADDKYNAQVYQNMFIGGIYLPARPNKANYTRIISRYQKGAIIPFFVTVDLEGCWNPFAHFQEYPALGEIASPEEAFALGEQQGKLLRELGFNINFAPVVDLDDSIWKCRTFKGDPEEIADKAEAYITGLQNQGVIATAKHYPGKTLISKDPHKQINRVTIDESDLFPFRQSIKDGVRAVMISHMIVSGSVDSEEKPAVTSVKLVANLRRDYDGLIISDEIRMLGIDNFYATNEEKFIDLFKTDLDLIINFDAGPRNIYDMITVIENAVKSGEISERRIDKSVIRILHAKGIEIMG